MITFVLWLLAIGGVDLAGEIGGILDPGGRDAEVVSGSPDAGPVMDPHGRPSGSS